MHSLAPLPDFLGSRLDAVGFALLAGAVSYACWHFVQQRHPGQKFSRPTMFVVPLLVIAGAILADWMSGTLGSLPGPRLSSVVIARAAAFGGTALVIYGLLARATVLALMEAELREYEGAHDLCEADARAESVSPFPSEVVVTLSHG